MYGGSNSAYVYSVFLVRLFAAACVTLAGCVGPELLKEAQSLESSMSVAEAKDERILASIEAVILRNGAGTWALDAAWDEYRIRIRSLSDEPVKIREVAIFDALDHRIESRSTCGELEDATRETERRYAQSGRLAKARWGNGWVVAGVGGIGVASPAVYSVPSAMVDGMAVAGAILAPLDVTGISRGFVGAGVKRLLNNAKINSEIKRRRTALPFTLPRGADTSVDIFFPITPLSGRTQVVYADRHGEHRLDIDTRQALEALEPTPTILTDPIFPEHARRAGATRGYVRAQLTLNGEGLVQDVELIESIPWRLFDEDARRTFLEWTCARSRFDTRIVEARLEFKR